MNSAIFRIVLMMVIVCVVANALDFGKYLPLKPTEQEKKICKENANGKSIRRIYKKPLRTCYIQCLYQGERKAQEFLTPDDTMCCDIVGVGPTGKCKNGECILFVKQAVEEVNED